MNLRVQTVFVRGTAHTVYRARPVILSSRGVRSLPCSMLYLFVQSLREAQSIDSYLLYGVYGEILR